MCDILTQLIKRNYVVFSDKCFKVHEKMPYRWEVKEDSQWKTLPDNEAIEKDYCDPKNTYRCSLSASGVVWSGNVATDLKHLISTSDTL